MKNHKRFATLVSMSLLCLAMSAAAQNVLDFNGLPRTGAPKPIPSGYGGMNWGNFDYITEQLTQGLTNVAFPAFANGLGPTVETMSAVDPEQGFHLIGAAVTGPYNTTLTLSAYNEGEYVGSQSYPLAPVLPPIRIPSSWGAITQVKFVCTDSQGKSAIFNLFSLTFQ
jgi:hypothetical protein